MGVAPAFAASTLRTSWSRALGYSPAMVDDAALERDEVLTRVRARVLAFARARRFPDPEDVAQEALLLLSTKYAHVAAAEELVAIGARIVHLKRSAHWTKAARRRALGEAEAPSTDDGAANPFELAPSDAPDPEAIAHARQRLSMLVEAAAKLNGKCREILRRKVQGASLVEIASELGRPVGTVYSWDHRCHKRLKGLLGDHWSFVSGQREDER
jgi:RNA polymerase sigma factor (sigma-70 family)